MHHSSVGGVKILKRNTTPKGTKYACLHAENNDNNNTWVLFMRHFILRHSDSEWNPLAGEHLNLKKEGKQQRDQENTIGIFYKRGVSDDEALETLLLISTGCDSVKSDVKNLGFYIKTNIATIIASSATS